MVFTGITLITKDVPKLIDFYENIFQIPIEKNETHTQFNVGNVNIALYSENSAETDMDFYFTQYNGTGKMTIGFDVDDIETEIGRLNELGVEFVTDPAVYPWGAKAVHFRDPDGNIICFRSWDK